MNAHRQPVLAQAQRLEKLLGQHLSGRGGHVLVVPSMSRAHQGHPISPFAFAVVIDDFNVIGSILLTCKAEANLIIDTTHPRPAESPRRGGVCLYAAENA
jgi:hypothetical protein